MTEYDIYLPAAKNDGSAIEQSHVQSLKKVLTDAFGGFTHLNHSVEGVWKVGDRVFQEEVTIVRVIDDGRAELDMQAFKKDLEAAMEQHTVLIVRRTVEII